MHRCFTSYWHKASPAGHTYGCVFCPYTTGRLRGNALGRAARGKAEIDPGSRSQGAFRDGR